MELDPTAGHRGSRLSEDSQGALRGEGSSSDSAEESGKSSIWRFIRVAVKETIIRIYSR